MSATRRAITSLSSIPKPTKVVNDIAVSRRAARHAFQRGFTATCTSPAGDDDVIDVIDVATSKVVGKLVTGSSPETFAMDETRRRIYVSDEESSTLAIINMDRNIIEKEVPTGAEPEGVLVSADGKTVYVTSEVGDLVQRHRRRQRLRDARRGGRHTAAPFRSDPGRQGALGVHRNGGRGLHRRRQKFIVTGKIDFLPPGMRKSDVTPVGLVMTKDGKDRLCHAWACGACRGGRRADASRPGLYLGRQAVMGRHAVA